MQRMQSQQRPCHQPIYIAGYSNTMQHACAAAGFVGDNICTMTNLSWRIDGDDLTE